MAYSNLWPHVRPWHLSKPEPMLRDLPKAAQVARLLGDALAAASPAAERTMPADISAKSAILKGSAIPGLSVASGHPA